MPQNVMAMGVSAFGFSVSWEPPLDNGGRPVTSYQVVYTNLDGVATMPFVTVPGNVTGLLLRNGGDPIPPENLINSTSYRYMYIIIYTCMYVLI